MGTLETHGKANSEVDIQKSSETVTQTKKHKEHGSDYNHKSSDEAERSGAHHIKHDSFKSRKFNKHTKTSHKHGHQKGKLPESGKGKIGKNKGKKKKNKRKKNK